MKGIISTKHFRNFKDSESGKLRVLMIQANDFASGYYRIGFLAEELAKRGNIDIDFCSRTMGIEDILWRIGKSDIVVFQLQTTDISVQVVDICKKNGIAVVMDMDDDLLDVPEWNPAYWGLGRKHSTFWETETKKMDIKANIERLENLKDMLRKVDLITVTGVGLRDEYSKYNKIKILPNLADPDKIKPSRRSGGMFDNKIRIFWQGSATHIRDLVMLRIAVQAITKKYPNVIWTIMGSGYEQFYRIMGIEKNRVEFIESVEMADYYKKVSKIKMDIGICPLVDIPYNRCKSNIKWIEYSMLGIPSVVSDIITYTNSVRHKISGYVAETPSEWIAYLSMLIDNPNLRELIANNAKAQILQDFNIHNKINLWEDTYNKVHLDNLKKNGQE